MSTTFKIDVEVPAERMDALRAGAAERGIEVEKYVEGLLRQTVLTKRVDVSATLTPRSGDEGTVQTGSSSEEISSIAPESMALQDGSVIWKRADELGIRIIFTKGKQGSSEGTNRARCISRIRGTLRRLKRNCSDHTGFLDRAIVETTQGPTLHTIPAGQRMTVWIGEFGSADIQARMEERRLNVAGDSEFSLFCRQVRQILEGFRTDMDFVTESQLDAAIDAVGAPRPLPRKWDSWRDISTHQVKLRLEEKEFTVTATGRAIELFRQKVRGILQREIGEQVPITITQLDAALDRAIDAPLVGFSFSHPERPEKRWARSSDITIDYMKERIGILGLGRLPCDEEQFELAIQRYLRKQLPISQYILEENVDSAIREAYTYPDQVFVPRRTRVHLPDKSPPGQTTLRQRIGKRKTGGG